MATSPIAFPELLGSNFFFMKIHPLGFDGCHSCQLTGQKEQDPEALSDCRWRCWKFNLCSIFGAEDIRYPHLRWKNSGFCKGDHVG